MDNKIYLNTAGTGIVTKKGSEKAQDFIAKTTSDPTKAFFSWMENDLKKLRNNTAKLVQTSPNNIAFAPNYSFGMTSILQGIIGKVQNVLLYKNDYPSVNMPFELGQFSTFYVDDEDGFKISNDSIIEAIKKNNIELVVFSHVQFLTGFKIDIEKIGNYCHENGVLFIVDATQSMGSTQLNFDKLLVDVIIASGYKWLNGGYGSAIICVKPSFITKYPPHIAGLGSLDLSSSEWKYVPSNKSFEPGHLNAVSLIQLSEGINEKLALGLEKIQKHNDKLIRQLHDGIKKLSYSIVGEDNLKERLHILIFKSPQSIANQLIEKGFSITWRKETIRVSPHFYNTKEEIDAFLVALSECN